MRNSLGRSAAFMPASVIAGDCSPAFLTPAPRPHPLADAPPAQKRQAGKGNQKAEKQDHGQDDPQRGEREGIDRRPGVSADNPGHHEPGKKDGGRPDEKSIETAVEEAFQQKQGGKLSSGHAQAFVYGEFPPAAHRLRDQQIAEIQQGDPHQNGADDELRKHHVQPGVCKVGLIFAAAGDGHAPVQPLFKFVQISLKVALAAVINIHCHLPDSLTAPIHQGDVVGTVTLTIQGQTIGTVDLIAGSDVSRNQVLYTISRIGEFFSSTYFKVVIMLTMAVAAVYTFIWVLSILGVWSRESENK